MKTRVALVLSGGITHSGRLPFFVKSRLDHACKLYHNGMLQKIMVAGKWSYLTTTPPKKTEAQAMKEYLESLGVQSAHVLLEERSMDLLSCAYFVKKLMLKKKIVSFELIGSDYQEERARYVFGHVYGPQYSIKYRFVASHLPPSLLWGYYRYEKKTLLHTKAVVKKIPEGSHEQLSQLFFKGVFYEGRRPGHIRSLVAQGKIGKPARYGAHYSLKGMYKKKKELYKRFALTDRRPRTLVADFWSGRFLNFSAQDPRGTLFSLKFLLRPQDRKTFKAEIKLTEAIREKGIDCIPKVLYANVSGSPMWYIYKVIPGKMAGEFSTTYSINAEYQQPYFAREYAHHLKQLRTLTMFRDRIPINGQSFYRKQFKKTFKKILQFKEFSTSARVRSSLAALEKKRKLLFSSCVYLSHNDLHPGNLIVDKGRKKLYLIDLEHVAYNNIAFDFCFAYIFCWDNPNFQHLLMREFEISLDESQRDEFRKIFPHVYAFFLIWFAGFVGHWRDRAGDERFKQARRMILSELGVYLKHHKK